MDKIILKYSSPCYPPKGIKMENTYYLEKLDGKYFLICGEQRIEMVLETIKSLFKIQNGSWDLIEENKTEEIDNEMVVNEETEVIEEINDFPISKKKKFRK